jgi:hemoglobin/transferrin/lactoferrin receptor protein
MPSLFESTLGLFTTAVLTADLRPERSHMWELGASTLQNNLFADGDSGGLKFAYFNNKINDFITRDYSSFEGGYIRNVKSFTVSGMELQASYDMGRFFADLSGTYYFHARTCAPDLAKQLTEEGWGDTPDCVDGGFPGSYTNMQNPPKYSINMTLGTRWLDEKLTIGGRAVYNSGPTEKLDQEWNIGISTNQIIYKPAVILDAFASYEFNKETKLDFSVQNITNQFYLDPLAQSFMPAPGRTFKTALTFKF